MWQHLMAAGEYNESKLAINHESGAWRRNYRILKANQ